MPSAVTDETSSKKRRNLMLTVSAILISGFLKLPVPTAIISAMNIPASESIRWRIWAVALALLAYQTWRFLTDSQTATTWRRALDAFVAFKGAYLAKLLERRLWKAVNGKKLWLDQIEWASHSSRPGETLTYSGFLFAYQDETGAVVKAVQNPEDSGTIRVAYTGVLRPSRQEIGAIGTLNYQLGMAGRWLYRVRALRVAFARSDAVQDCVVPIVLVVPATLLCINGIITYWTL